MDRCEREEGREEEGKRQQQEEDDRRPKGRVPAGADTETACPRWGRHGEEDGVKEGGGRKATGGREGRVPAGAGTETAGTVRGNGERSTA